MSRVRGSGTEKRRDLPISENLINDQRDILAEGIDKGNHEFNWYLLTPTGNPTCRELCQVSEPGTPAHFGLGLTGLGLMLRRRNRLAS